MDQVPTAAAAAKAVESAIDRADTPSTELAEREIHRVERGPGADRVAGEVTVSEAFQDRDGALPEEPTVGFDRHAASQDERDGGEGEHGEKQRAGHDDRARIPGAQSGSFLAQPGSFVGHAEALLIEAQRAPALGGVESEILEPVVDRAQPSAARGLRR